jgi:quinoprotein glucose dehydrogenase
MERLRSFKAHLSHRRGAGNKLAIAFGVLLLLFGATLLVGGIRLIALGGAWYYAIAGAGFVAAAIGLFVGALWGITICVLTYFLTWIWALSEVGWNGWALVPWIVVPTILTLIALCFIPTLRRGSVAAMGSAASSERSVPRAPDASRRPQALVRCAPAIALVAAAGALLYLGNAAKGAAAPSTISPPPAVASAVGDAGGRDWPEYGGTNHALRYSTLNQINRGNVARLQRAWIYRTGDMPDAKSKDKYSPETTPIKVGDRVYLCSAKNIMIALDAATGKEQWRFDPKVPDEAIPYGATCRGVAYYKAANAVDAACAERIVEATLDARLLAVDATTGKPCADFGTNGSVDLGEGMGATVPGWYGNVAAPTIVRNVVVIGGQVKDNEAHDAPSGVIRGYDVVSGKLAWAWDMGHPDRTGAPPAGQTYSRGTPNMWTSAAGDDALGYVYVPLGNAADDYYGAERTDFDNRYNSSLVAIDVTTGKEAWHFQTVHRDVWDYDLGSQPTLVNFPSQGGTVPAVILPSKQGEIYVLDRRTGTSLFPVEERPAPTGGVEPRYMSPTQPYSGYHSVAKKDLTEKDMWGMSPIDQMWCRIQFRQKVYQGRYTPPSTKWYLEYPGYNGGTDWGSAAVDPQRNLLIVNYNDMPNNTRLLTRAEADAKGIEPINVPHREPKPGRVEFGAMAGVPYAAEVNPAWRIATGLMCTRPPYGGITAIDLATGRTIWDRPLGQARENGPWNIPSELPIAIGTPNNGGALVTAGGLIFIAAATDNLIRAIDIDSGKVVWQDRLPAGGQATPMAFEQNGREYIGFMAGGHHFMQTPVGDYVIAYALPA